MANDSRYHVGDKVIIRENDKSPYGRTDQMDKLNGMECTIESVNWNFNRTRCSYRLREDPGGWTWHDTDFESTVIDLPEFTVDTAGLPSLFS